MRTVPRVDLDILFQVMFSARALRSIYLTRYSEARSRGLDRVSGRAFSAIADEQLEIASKKCISGTYKFTPYLEVLKVKDRASFPRMISIPTIRDRVVLAQLNGFLRIAFKAESKMRLASDWIREISEVLRNQDPRTSWTAGLDIRKFYDSIDRIRLQKLVASRIGCDSPAYDLIACAIGTPTVPKLYKRKDLNKYHSETGVPQGLSISNSLAAIYMYEIDEPMSRLGVKYYRFVDDVLLVGSERETAKAAKSFAARARARCLSLHDITSSKGHHLPIASPFNYLGYRFELPRITVRESTVQRLLHSIAAKITDYKYNKDRILDKKKYLTEKTLRDSFLDELDERISGAISGKRRYGWIAYFSQITDESVLHRIDAAVAKMLTQNRDLAEHALSVKRFGRAIFEIRFRPLGGYVRNYDMFRTPVQKLKFLIFRGEVDEAAEMSEAQIERRFEAYRDRQLSEMLADEGSIY